MRDVVIAYCGPAAVPDDLWARWNADPVLIAALVALAFVVGRGRALDARRFRPGGGFDAGAAPPTASPARFCTP